MSCSTNGSFIRWDASPPGAAPGTGLSLVVYEMRDVSVPYISINQVDYLVMRTSMVSVVLIDNVTTSLNGVTLNCTRNEGTTATIIDVITNGEQQKAMS